MNSEWLTYIKQATKTGGQIETTDGFVIDWKRSGILSPDLAHFKNAVSELASEELAPIELQFLSENPEAASQELFLKPCTDLLENGADWNVIKEKIQETIQQFYRADLSKFGLSMIEPLMEDIYFFATIKNKKEDKLLGFILFAATPALPFGDIKVINFLVRSTESNRGLEKFLMNLIFELVPETKKVFLFVRPTNETAIQMYHSLGFTQDQSPFQDPHHKINAKYLMPLEYNIRQSVAKIDTV